MPRHTLSLLYHCWQKQLKKGRVARWCTPLILPLRAQRQVISKFKVSLVYNLVLKNEKKRGGIVLVHDFSVQFITAREAWRQVCEALITYCP